MKLRLGKSSQLLQRIAFLVFCTISFTFIAGIFERRSLFVWNCFCVWKIILESLTGCLTELCALDFYWISINFGFLWYSSFVINFPRFFKPLFWLMKVLLLRYSQNNYQIWWYKLNVMCEELSYQNINNSAVNQAVLFYY